MKFEKLLKDFTEYCKKNPAQRFWQALTNWSGFQSICLRETDNKEILIDTFYWEHKNK